MQHHNNNCNTTTMNATLQQQLQHCNNKHDTATTNVTPQQQMQHHNDATAMAKQQW